MADPRPMHLLDLQFPIAVVLRVKGKPISLWGGRNAALSSAQRYGFNVASFYLKGAYDDALFIDSRGGLFEVKRIYLNHVSVWRALARRAAHLFVLPDRNLEATASVDFDLFKIRQYTLDEFCTEYRNLVLSRPEWWRHQSSETEVSRIFEGVETFSQAIDDIGVLEPPRKEKLPGFSTKIVDRRNGGGQ